jgi:hypothetical protein
MSSLSRRAPSCPCILESAARAPSAHPAIVLLDFAVACSIPTLLCWRRMRRSGRGTRACRRSPARMPSRSLLPEFAAAAAPSSCCSRWPCGGLGSPAGRSSPGRGQRPGVAHGGSAPDPDDRVGDRVVSPHRCFCRFLASQIERRRRFSLKKRFLQFLLSFFIYWLPCHYFCLCGTSFIRDRNHH